METKFDLSKIGEMQDSQDLSHLISDTQPTEEGETVGTVPQEEPSRCGFVSLLGQPNAGKSTLLNAILGAKLAAVCNKPQTTRTRIMGIHTRAKTQVLFVDTPGIHRAQGLPALNKAMNDAAWNALRDIELAVYMVDVTAGWTEDDSFAFQKLLKKTDKSVLMVASKCDVLKKDRLEESLLNISSHFSQLMGTLGEEAEKRLLKKQFWPLSAKRPEEVQAFTGYLEKFMPASPWLYSGDNLTDLPQKFICAELVREQLFRQLGKELPYHAAVAIDEFKHKKTLTVIKATIIVQRESHKPMVIGKRGARIKEVGAKARESLESHLDRKVFLELFVKVQPKWFERPETLMEFTGLDRFG